MVYVGAARGSVDVAAGQGAGVHFTQEAGAAEGAEGTRGGDTAVVTATLCGERVALLEGWAGMGGEGRGGGGVGSIWVSFG